MQDIQIIQVHQHEQCEWFHAVPRKIYARHPQWIEPIAADVEECLQSARDKGLGVARWIAMSSTGELMGRIAAFDLEPSRKDGNQEKRGGIGFFESVEDAAVARALFGAAEGWLAARGIREARGPINPGNKDSFWGLLVEGFDQSPSYRKSYHLPYYQAFFTDAGYELDYEQYVFKRCLKEGVPEALKRKLKRVFDNPRFSFRDLHGESLEGFEQDLRRIFNTSWAEHPDFKPLTEEQVAKMVKKMKPILDRRLLWRAFDGKEAIGFMIFLPEINALLADARGKLGLWQKIKLAWRLKTGGATRATGLVFGVLPEYQGSGLAHALVTHAGEAIRALGDYREFELNWVGSFNHKMIALVESFGARKSKVFATYKKELLPC